MDQTAFSFYSAIFNTLSLSSATSPPQSWTRCTQPHQAFHPEKTAARGRGGSLFIICLWAPQPNFLHLQSGRIEQNSETKCRQGRLGRPDWLRQTRTELPGPGRKPVSPETHGHGDQMNTYSEVWKKREWIWKRHPCSFCVTIIN